LDKLKSNLQKFKACIGQIIVFEVGKFDISSESGFKDINATIKIGRFTAPITYYVLLQLISYHVAID
jgi:glucosamine--fructose-6-phosphate aminotransferase (isomerizing)